MNVDIDDVLIYLEEARPLYMERKKERAVRRKTCVAALAALSCCLAVAFMPHAQRADNFSFVLYDDDAFSTLLAESSYIPEYGMFPLDNYGLLALN